MVQWLRLSAPHAGNLGSIYDWGTKILPASGVVKKTVYIFMEIILNVWSNSSNCSLYGAESSCPWTGLFLCVVFFPSYCSSEVLQCSYSLGHFLKFISRYYIFSDSTVNGVFPFILLSDQSAIYCSVGVLYLTNFILTLLTVFLFTVVLNLQYTVRCWQCHLLISVL